MNTWYKVDKWKFTRGKITEVEVTKETDKCVFIKAENFDRVDRYNKQSVDYRFFPTLEAATMYAEEIINASVQSYQSEIERLEARSKENLDRLSAS